MKRKQFIKNTALTAAGAIAAPYILPSGRLFAATGSAVADHVVFCLFAGGVRNKESVQMADGNLMRNMLTGTQSITPDIAGSMTPLPSLGLPTLQQQGTLFKDFSYVQGPTGHYNGHITALTGKYADEAVQLKQPPKYPTIFEYYRKHTSPSKSALKSWWVCDSLGPYPYLNYSLYNGYGPMYGANTIQPASIFSSNSNSVLGNPYQFSGSEKSKCDLMKDLMNGQFRTSTQLLSNGIQNTPDDAEILQTFLKQLMTDTAMGLYNDPWNLGPGVMNNDMFNVFAGIKIMERFAPELMVINMQGIDIAHFDFTQYANNMRKADFALAKLWHAIQTTDGMENTVLIVAPEHGRNLDHNTVVDVNGRYALDHNSDEESRKIFCMMVGAGIRTNNVVAANPPVTDYVGQSIDIVPTIAHLLGFGTSITDVALQGRVLTEAF